MGRILPSSEHRAKHRFAQKKLLERNRQHIVLFYLLTHKAKIDLPQILSKNRQLFALFLKPQTQNWLPQTALGEKLAAFCPVLTQKK